jgi:hypothetical protein
MVVGRGQVPEPDGVVARAGEEGVGGGAEGYRGHGVGVAFEVADVRVVVRGEVADRVVDFGACVDNALRVVREARQVHAVFLRLELFGMFTLLTVVNLERVVVAGYNGKFACVIEVERGDGGGAWTGRFEALERVSITG